MRLGKWSKDLRFEIIDEIVSPSCFELVARTHARILKFFCSRLPFSFQNQIFPLLSDLNKEYIKLNVSKVLDKMTRGVVSPLTR